MRSFKDGDTIMIEPWRATAFPVIKDLVVDRSAFDRIIAAGGFISVPTGSAPDGNAIPVPKADRRPAPWTPRPASAAAPAWPPARTPRRCSSRRPRSRTSACCRRASPSAGQRVRQMVAQMDAEGFGNCTNHGECEAACPKEISARYIARMNRDYIAASLRGDLREAGAEGGAG